MQLLKKKPPKDVIYDSYDFHERFTYKRNQLCDLKRTLIINSWQNSVCTTCIWMYNHLIKYYIQYHDFNFPVMLFSPSNQNIRLDIKRLDINHISAGSCFRGWLLLPCVIVKYKVFKWVRVYLS